ncbi:ribonuclease H-like domain-containing protein [Tanacetum coccineum]
MSLHEGTSLKKGHADTQWLAAGPYLKEEPAPTGDQSGPSAPPVPKTAKQLAARRNQERVKSILLLAIPNEYLLKFHNVANVKSLWEAIKSSQLEVHGAPISKKDINQKFLRSLPSSWNQIALIMRNKPNIDEIDIDDLYNNLRVYEDELKKSLGSNSASQNLAFLSSENTGGTNEVSTASGDFGISTAGGINQVPSTPCAHDVAYSFLAQPTTTPQLENEDFQQMDGDDLEELDLRWQVAMLTVRVKKKGHFARECGSERNQRRRSYGDNGRSNAPTNEYSSQALVAQDGLGGYDWSNDFEVEPVNYALMAISSSSSSSSSDSEGEKYEFQNYELKCREIKIKYLNMELEKVVKERDELKDKIAKWEESTKNLDEILNSQMSARDKTGLGYSTQLNELSSNHETDSENSFSIFDGRSSYEDSTPANDRSSKIKGYKVVPPPITGNLLTPRADISFAGLDKYAIRNKIIESQTTELNTKTSETAGQTNAEKPKSASESVVSNPKINRDRVIIEDWNSDDEEEEYEVQTVRPETQTVKTRDDKSGQNSKKQGIGFRKVKACFVCKSTDHLIKDWHIQRTCLQDACSGDSGCSSHMTGNKAYLSDYEDFNGGFVAFGSDPKGDELKFNLFFVSQMCDKKNSVLFTESECVILSPSFKILDESQVVLRAPRKDDVYSLDLKNIVPSGGLENQLSHNVKIIRCDNGTEFKNHAMNEFCIKKGIKREFSVARTPQQNGVAEKKNKTLIEAARTMLADSLLPIPFWAKAVKTACYVLNRVLVTKPQNKTPYELLIGYLLGYSTSSKAFKVYNKRTKRVEENLHINFLEDQSNVTGTGPNWMFDLDFLTNSMNYIPVSVENQVNVDAVQQDSYVQVFIRKSKDLLQRCGNKESEHDLQEELSKWLLQELAAKAMKMFHQDNLLKKNRGESHLKKKAAQATSTNKLSTDRPSVSTDRPFISTDRSKTPNDSTASTFTGANADESSFVYLGGKIPIDASTLPNDDLPIDPNMPDLEDASDTLPNDGIFNRAYDDDEDENPHQHSKQEWNSKGFFSTTSLEPKTISRALQDESWVEAMQEKLLQFKTQKVWVVVDLQYGKKVKQHPDGIFISQDKYVADILKKFDFWTIKTATTPIESNKPLVKDEDGVDVDVHVYMSMIGSLMLWYPKDSPFELEAYSDSDYGGASLDKKSTTAQYDGLFGKDGWKYRVSLDYGLSHTQFNLLCTHYAIVAGKPVTISEASIRSDLLFNDANGIDTLNN